MRLDKFLSVARLVKQRTTAKEMCEDGRVQVNGKRAKAAHNVRPGEVIELMTVNRRLTFRILAVPDGKNVPKDEANKLYEIVTEEHFNLKG